MDERNISTDPGSIRPMRICPRATDKGAFADFLLIKGSPVDNLDILADKEHMRVMMKAENLQKYKGSSLKMGFVRRSAKARKQLNAIGKEKIRGMGN